MERFIDEQLTKWKESKRRKPLILRGVRQVGKTYSVTRFGKRCFENVAVVDLERNTSWHRVFSGDLNAQGICAELEILLNQKIVPGKTLLFIDELQACPRAITALRYFYEELPGLHVIGAGSLLEFALRHISFPVGRIQFAWLRPLSFAEYLMATGNEAAAGVILGTPGEVPQTVHELLCNELRRYFFIGGMPESIRAYAETGSIQESFKVQAEICETYQMDFAKYSPKVDRDCLHTVFTTLCRSVGRQVKYSRLGDNYSNPTLKRAFDLLRLATLVKHIPSVDPSGLPLGVIASEKVFKALLVDIGLMRYLSGMPVEVEYGTPDLLNIYNGAMAEQFVGQEMVLSQQGNLYYWSRQAKSSSAEVDYIGVINGKIHPIEVKSGSSGRLKSLHLFLRSYQNSSSGIVFSMRPYEELPGQHIVFMPLYFAYSATGGRGND